MKLKRNNWTNEEVMAIAKGCTILTEGSPSPAVKSYNEGVMAVVHQFGDFAVPDDANSAMSYDTDTGRIFHTGTMLPQ